MAAKYSFSVDQGATFRKTFVWKAPSEGDPNVTVPVDLTGFTARMQLRLSVDSDVVVLALTTENDRIFLGAQGATPDPSTGEISLFVDAATMEGIVAGTYFYDLELVSADDIVTRLVQGKVKVVAEVTR